VNVALWIVQGLLALVFLVSGSVKNARPRHELQSMLPYVEDLSDVQLKAIGLLEILAAIGMVLPSVFKVTPVLTPIAAVGLILLMLGAMATHVRRGETGPALSINVILLLLALFVAWGRFGPYQI
jgi:uncharacterized membrane protein YphA (DoxX/SURF4 family)